MGNQDVSLISDHKDIVPILQSSLYPGASIDSVKMVLSYCEAAHLDPMQKPVHIVPMWDGKSRQMRDVVMPGIGLYRIQAARSGEYGGISEPAFGPDVKEPIGGIDITYPLWCRVTVCRLVQGHKVEFSATERWVENYAVKGGKEQSVAPNKMWARRPYAQLAKCAEAQALRKAFPEVGAAPTAEEMEDKSIDGDYVETGPEYYPQSDFDSNFPSWESVAKESGNIAGMLKHLKGKGVNLSPEQIDKIKNIGVE